MDQLEKYEMDRLVSIANHTISQVERLQAELAALRPWAALGERAIREEWFYLTYDDDEEWNVTQCLACKKILLESPIGHTPDCPIPALLAQLETPHDPR